MAQCPTGYTPRLFWPGSHFYGFMGRERNLWRPVYSRATSAGTFASWVAVASPLVTDPPAFLSLFLSLSLTLGASHPRMITLLLIFRSSAWGCSDARDQPPPAFPHSPRRLFPPRPRLVQWLHHPLYHAGIDAPGTARVARVQS